MPAITYASLAVNCPPLQVPSAIKNPADADPLIGPYITAGETTTLVPKWNETALRGNQGALWDGGACALLCGGALSSGTGLILNIALLWAIAGLDDANDDRGGYVYKAASTLALTDDRYNWVYVTGAGVISKVTQATAPSPPALPALSNFLGRVLCASGAQTEIDDSGVWRLVNGVLQRQTIDIGPPTDSPSANSRGRTLTQDGIYEWTGAAYRADWLHRKDLVASGEAQYVGANEQAIFYRNRTVLGKSVIRGLVVVRGL